LYKLTTFKDGKITGPFKTYYDSGSFYRVGTYINFKYDGIVIQYFEDGVISDIEYQKENINITRESEENMKKVLKEVENQRKNGVDVSPLVYMNLCKELGIDATEFEKSFR